MIESLTNDADDSHAKPTGGCCQKKNESEKAGKHFSSPVPKNKNKDSRVKS